uniref:Uncharacterized protein n=2 Tax=Meloidogyne TaxID=189290 RepID=A0A6V7USM8_MELEN|nr:unnamed protein product [Meloidogyne enterolobii]
MVSVIQILLFFLSFALAFQAKIFPTGGVGLDDPWDQGGLRSRRSPQPILDQLDG